MANEKILIVEDEGIVILHIKKALESLGYKVAGIASSGEDAVVKASESKPDLVLMDIVLKGKGEGIEAAEKIRNLLNIPVIYLTAHADESTLERAKVSEPFGYIVKPLRERDLRIAIEFAMYKAKTEAELRRARGNLEKQVQEQTEELIKINEQLHDLTAHLQAVSEEERKSIAREIHDEMGQTLTALKFDLAWISDRYKDDEPFIERKNSMMKLVDSALFAVKKISADLRPGVLDHLGLSAAIEWYSSEFRKRTDISCEVSLNPKDIVLDGARSTTIFRIFQEALTNVARHARAANVHARLEMNDGKINLSIKDDGRGITEEEIADRQSFGLIGIRERVRAFNGELRISGASNDGTLVDVSLPLERVLEEGNKRS